LKRVMIMEGQVLGNRYQLVEKIGGGGMAIVYKAKCMLLNRYVAIKILRTEFTNDEEFVKRFRIEAQAAASLSHPNIVSIYDVGNENGIHYIVMEYIDGITLKEYISEKGVLPWKAAVNIAIQICSAIDQAHRNHIVHRDIKPHNILLTKDGIAKVTDFGIARAVSSSTITMVGSTIGSVHYFSPEQARGGYIDEKSDLYSLGIALYEMTTGRVPFEGETPVAIALKHIQEHASQPIEINESIPQGVNDIIMKAIEKDQSKRYQSAHDMLSDLHNVLREPDLKVVTASVSEDYPTRRIEIINDSGQKQKEETVIKNKNINKEKKRDRLTMWLAVATSLILIAIFGYVGYSIVIPSIAPESNDFVVDNYVGKNISDVREELEKNNIEVIEEWAPDDNVQKGVIIDQSLTAGQKLKLSEKNSIKFEVSDGPELKKMPDLQNVEGRIAEADLKQLEMKYRIVEEYSDSIATGYVIRTDPQATVEVEPGSTVTIYLSKGPELKTVLVPNLIGRTRTEANQILIREGLTVGKMEPADVVSDVAKIIEQNPVEGTEVNEGSAVDITFEVITENETEEDEQPTSGKTAGGRRTFVETISLGNPDNYGNRVRVRVEVMPSDANATEVLIDEWVNKARFPLAVDIPVPVNGSTGVRVYINNKLYTEFFRQ
jgi:serine/threonine protein kinase